MELLLPLLLKRLLLLLVVKEELLLVDLLLEMTPVADGRSLLLLRAGELRGAGWSECIGSGTQKGQTATVG